MLDKSRLSQPINVDENEVAKFNRMAQQWWDPNGQFKTALAFNQARLGYFKQMIERGLNKPWNALSVLDVGSGGGLVSEHLAALGADVLGIDASATSVEVARAHAAQQGVSLIGESGVALNPFTQKWRLTDNMGVNYMQCFRKAHEAT